MFVSISIGTNTYGASTLDKDNNGRVSQGYILIGESHVGVYTASFMNPGAVRTIKSPGGNGTVMYIPYLVVDPNTGIPTVTNSGTTSDQSVLYLVSTLNGPTYTDGYISDGGEATNIALDIIDKNTQIEHWNIIVSWGTNNMSGGSHIANQILQQVDDFYNRMLVRFNDKVTVYYATVPPMNEPPWPVPGHASNVATLQNVMQSTKASYINLENAWKNWTNKYMNNEPLDVGDEHPYNGAYDGCHVSHKAYQDVFGRLIEELEYKNGYTSTGHPMPEQTEDYKGYGFVQWEEMQFRVNGYIAGELSDSVNSTYNARTYSQINRIDTSRKAVNTTGDNGYVQAFYDGLLSIGVPMEEIGDEDAPCVNAEMFVWNVWNKYATQYFENDRLNKDCFELVQNQWSYKTKTDVILAYECVPRAFMELDNAGTLTWIRGSLNNRQYCDRDAVQSIFRDYMLHKDKCFYVIQAGGSGNSLLSPSGVVKYFRLVDATSSSLKFQDPMTGVETVVNFRDSDGRFIDNVNSTPFGIMDYYRFEYQGETKESSEPPKPVIPSSGTWEHLTINNLDIKVPNYNGTAEFVYLSDLHLITAECGRKDMMYALSSVKDGGVTYLREVVAYCNQNNYPLILGGDIVDYASADNYYYLTGQLNQLTVPFMYIRADHDVGTDLSNAPHYGDHVKALSESGMIPGVFSGDWNLMVVNGLNIYGWNWSTDKTNNSAVNMSLTSPAIVCTHVPFSLSGVDSFTSSWQQTNGNGPRIYNWTESTSGYAIYSYSKSSRAAAAIRTIKNGASYIIAGHLHYPSNNTFSDGSLGELIASPGYLGNITKVTVTGG